GGLTLTILPAPNGPAPDWLKAMAGVWSFLPRGIIAALWWALCRTPFHAQLRAVGSDDRAAYTAGVPVTLTRFLAYVLTGLLAGAAGMMLTALIGSADPKVGANYTLIAIAAVALGGVSLAGGRGGLLGAAIGAIDIFLLQSLLTAFNVSTYVLQVAYGTILVVAVVLIALQDRSAKRSHA
ncbi:MAG: transporter permease, partial [Cypionkella sp.]|nr:transporter permease [Cypionkella sp.]